MLELSMTLAKFSGAEAEELRRAMGFTKNSDRLGKSIKKLEVALEKQGYNERVIQKVVTATTSFAAYGFPESHAIGFAMLAYASTWLKLYRTAEFYASLLNNQPMGFYSPATLLQDGRRHKLQANPVCVAASDWVCTIEAEKTIRIGLRFVKGIRETAVQQMLVARSKQPFTSMADFLRRTDFTPAERRALAAVGAFQKLARHRRAALWQVAAAWSDAEALFKYYADTVAGLAEAGPGSPTPATENTDSPLPSMSKAEELHADFAGLGLTTSEHPMALLRSRLPDVCPANRLLKSTHGQRITIAGSVICRQRPGTAKGFVFISLEDETGIANAIVVPDLFERFRLTITQESALRITGRLQKVSGVTHVKAEQIVPLREADLPAQVSYDFH
jgi:error-prone DNA polymerase